MESHHDLTSLFEHDLFGKSVSTFPDHALKLRCRCASARPIRPNSLSHSGPRIRLPDRQVYVYECSRRRGGAAAGCTPWVSLNSSASFSVIAPPSSSASTM